MRFASFIRRLLSQVIFVCIKNHEIKKKYGDLRFIHFVFKINEEIKCRQFYVTLILKNIMCRIKRKYVKDWCRDGFTGWQFSRSANTDFETMWKHYDCAAFVIALFRILMDSFDYLDQHRIIKLSAIHRKEWKRNSMLASSTLKTVIVTSWRMGQSKCVPTIHLVFFTRRALSSFIVVSTSEWEILAIKSNCSKIVEAGIVKKTVLSITHKWY